MDTQKVKKKPYRNLNLPTELVNRVEEIMEGKELGYTSIAEFVKDAIRDKLQKVGGLG